mgnify:FL=1|tara:strand:- start:361 stop:1305 length:945 start_codon:yes stop_codon:yes gene_type:complete
MLGRNAAGIFWMFRYLERSENTARIMQAGHRMFLTSTNSGYEDWASILDAASLRESFEEKFLEFDAFKVRNFVLRDNDNPSSVMSCIANARENARMVRTVLTKEVFEAVNETYLILKEILKRPVSDRNLVKTLATIRRQSGLVRGSLHGTMLRNDIYEFARLGTFIERADYTARILDMKYYILLPSISFVGSSIDNRQWENVLRSVSAYRSYRWLNEYEISPQGICKFLILDTRFPRSLIFCARQLAVNLRLLTKEYDQKTKSGKLSRLFSKNLDSIQIDDIFEQGLHEFLRDCIANLNQLSVQIENDFGFYPS